MVVEGFLFLALSLAAGAAPTAVFGLRPPFLVSLLGLPRNAITFFYQIT